MPSRRSTAAALAAPFLVALGPITFLWANNADMVAPASVAGPAAMTLSLTALTLGGLLLLTRDPIRSGLILCIALVITLTFGHQLDALVLGIGGGEAGAETSGGDPSVLRWPLLGANLAAGTGLSLAVWRFRPQRAAASVALAAVVFNLLSVPPIVGALEQRPDVAHADSGSGAADQSLPDIYYIVLDGYSRHDVLREVHGFDNSAFLSGLAERGFHIAEEARSNYAMTAPSMASSLNMRYMASGDDARQMIHAPEVVMRLRELGYRYVHFRTPWWATQDAPLADIEFGLEGAFGEFELVFIASTLPGRFLEPPGVHRVHRYTLDHLPDVADIAGPTFTLAHLILPHPPYVFDSEGRVVSNASELSGGWASEPYVAQTQYLNKRVIGIVDQLIARSETPPIIIVQSDHGSARTLFEPDGDPRTGYWERMAILSAFLVPPAVESALYPSITPVNTFRVLFSEFFGEPMDLLPDVSLFSWHGDLELPALGPPPYGTTDVTEIVEGR